MHLGCFWFLVATVFNVKPGFIARASLRDAKAQKTVPFIRNSWQRYGFRRKGSKVSDLKQFRLGIYVCLQVFPNCNFGLNLQLILITNFPLKWVLSFPKPETPFQDYFSRL